MGRNDPIPSACDIAVIGGGIIGLAVARALAAREPHARIVLLEAEDQLAGHQSSHNSGVVHAGVYYTPGSLRAKLCVEGAASLKQYCEERELPWRESGKLILATTQDELARLDELERRGRANGVPGLERLGPGQVADIEPEARGLAALHSPATAVTDFAKIASAYAGDFELSGGIIRTGSPVLSADTATGASGGLWIRTPTGQLRSERAVFCAGLHSDRLARACGGSNETRIVPIRGGYLEVREGREQMVRGNVYPVPDPDLPFLGAHLTRTVTGSLLIGPTAVIVASREAYRINRFKSRDLADTISWPGTWGLMKKHWRASFHEASTSLRPGRLVEDAARLVPGLTRADVRPGPAGVRAQALDRAGNLVEDFLIEDIGPAVHVRNAPSPAATSSLALGDLIADRVLYGT